MNYVIGRNNLAATIFVPYDCKNNCPFCTSKSMYRNEEMNLDKILESIDIVNKWDSVSEFVISGGEPFWDIDTLKIILDRCDKRVFINTTLPLLTACNAITLINECDKIKGISISRQFFDIYPDKIAPSECFKIIDKPKRINVIVNNPFILDKHIDDFIKEYNSPNTIFNLRADYVKITNNTLKNRDEIVTYLAERYHYIGGGSCLVCNTDAFFDEENDVVIQYHRGLRYSAVRFENKTYINDIIIKPNGKMYDDWDFSHELKNTDLK